MSDPYWLSDTQMAKLEPFFPKSRGKPRVDDKRVMSGIIFLNRNGLRWRAATRYDWCPKVFLSACASAAVVMFWS